MFRGEKERGDDIDGLQREKGGEGEGFERKRWRASVEREQVWRVRGGERCRV